MMEPIKKKGGRPKEPNWRILYGELVYDLHHRLTKPTCSIKGILSLDLSEQAKLELIGQCVDLLEQKIHEINAKYSKINH